MRIATLYTKEHIQADDKRCQYHPAANDTRKGFGELLSS